MRTKKRLGSRMAVGVGVFDEVEGDIGGCRSYIAQRV